MNYFHKNLKPNFEILEQRELKTMFKILFPPEIWNTKCYRVKLCKSYDSKVKK